MSRPLSDLDQSEATVAVCDLLKGRVEELLSVWGKGSPDVCDLLNGILDTLADASGAAQAKIDAADLWDLMPGARDYSPLRSGSMQSDLE